MVKQVSDIEAFRMFNIDMGRAALSAAKQARKEGNRDDARKLIGIARAKWGANLWTAEKRVAKFGADTVKVNRQHRTKAEHRAKLAALAAAYAALEGEEKSPFDE